MDFLRINSSKLKITLTAEELRHYGIKETGGEFESRLVREVISDILEDAGAGGFCRVGEKLLVQLYPKEGGGAELFITKLRGVGERERRAVETAENVSTYRRESAVFVFDKLDDLLRAVRLPALRGKRADLYLRQDGKYLLQIDEERLAGIASTDVLLEFAARYSRGDVSPSPEWDKPLAMGDAIERLSVL